MGTCQQYKWCYRGVNGFKWLLINLFEALQILHIQPSIILSKNSTFCPHSIFMWSVWILEQTAIISQGSVFMAETESIYCSVRTGYLTIIGVNLDFLFNLSLRSAHTVYFCFVWNTEQTAIIYLHSINWLVFIAEMESVYCAVETGSFYMIQVLCFVFCVDLRTNSDYFPIQH